MVGEGRRVRLDALLNVFSVGSGDWPWTEEYDNLIDQADTRKLLERIRVEGIREPILLGNDGRVWDGHHRIVIAMHLGLDSVPVEFSGSPVVPEEPEWEIEVSYSSGSAPSIDGHRLRRAARVESVEKAREFAALVERPIIHKRTKAVPAGPWLPVEQEEE